MSRPSHLGIKEANKDKKAKEINELCNEEWNKLSDEQKKPFEDKAAELKKKFDEEKKKRKEAEPKDDDDDEDDGDAEEGSKKRKRGSKKAKDPNAPKKPLSAYMLWLKDNREKIKSENPSAKTTDIAKIAGVQWKALTDADKKPYNDQAATLKEEYQKKKAEYEGSEGAPAPKKRKTAAKKAKKNDDEDEDENDEDDE